VDEFFFNRATYKYIVWLTDHDTRSFQLFQLGTETLPRFYNVIYSSCISSVYYVLENPREYCLDSRTYLLFSPKTRVEYKYENGCRVITKGFLRVTFSDELKIILWEFEAKCHEEYLPTSIFRDKRVKRQQRTSLNLNPQENTTPCTPSGGEISLDSLPKSHVNQFGLPPPVMRCFEITEVINYMKDLIDFAMERNLAPLESLELYHKEIIDKPSQNSTPNEPEYNIWNTAKLRVKQASFLQPSDDIKEEHESLLIALDDPLIKSEKTEDKIKTEEIMDLNSIPTEPPDSSHPISLDIKEEKIEKPDYVEKPDPGNDKPLDHAKEVEDRMEEDEDDDKSDKNFKKRTRKSRAALQNIPTPPSQTQRPKRKQKK